MKVPVVPGIGTIAIGIAKAGADVITMSGYDGGTGAARQHALRRAGLPCEIGIVLAHHALTEAGIRDRVEIWADGGLRSAARLHQAASASAPTAWASAPPRWSPSAAPSAAAASSTPATWASRRSSTRRRRTSAA